MLKNDLFQPQSFLCQPSCAPVLGYFLLKSSTYPFPIGNIDTPLAVPVRPRALSNGAGTFYYSRGEETELPKSVSTRDTCL